jgi:hypothetical protein
VECVGPTGRGALCWTVFDEDDTDVVELAHQMVLKL